MSDMDDDSPCGMCEQAEWCDGWEAQFCCTLCMWQNDGEPPWCEGCDPMDV